METLQDLLERLPDDLRKPFLRVLRKKGHHTYSYADLSRISRQAAWGLIQEGIRPGDVVGLFAPLDFAWIAVCVGALQAGAVVMPLDLQLETETLAGILKNSEPWCIFTAPDRLKQLGQAAPAGLSTYVLGSSGRDGAANWKKLLINTRQTLPVLSADHAAALFYTSGTTGPPKGVSLSHRNLLFQIQTVQRTGLVDAGDRVLLPLPPHHVYPFVIGMLVPLFLGGTIVLPYSLTGPQMMRALREGDATLLIGVPRLYHALFAGITSRSASDIFRRLFEKGLDLDTLFRKTIGVSPGRWLYFPLRRRLAPHLKILASGGAPLEPGLASKLEALGWQVAIGYGLTETAPLLTLKLPGDPHNETVGRPVGGVHIRIDPGALPEPSLPDRAYTEGEILAKGPNVFSGYYRLPEKTDASFTRDGWFRTGDLGYVDTEGYLHVTGRVSSLIITEGGEKIQPDEIEAHLSAHALIREAGVLQLENGLLAAVIVPEIKEIVAQAIKAPERGLQRAIAEQSKLLPSFKRINDFAVTRVPLPRTRLGKLRRHLLPDIFREAKKEEDSPGRPESKPMSISAMSSQDRDLLENRAARIVWDWMAEKHPHQHITPDTSPELDLGIDSMEWLNITLEIRRQAGVELEEGEISEIATVRDLLQRVAEKAVSGEDVSPESPLEEPEKSLSGSQMRWLKPLRPPEAFLARGLFSVDVFIFRRFFHLKVQGVENLPAEGPFIITPNHASYVDPFAIAAALGWKRLRRVFWAGFTGIAFKNAFFRFFSRLSRTVPVDPDKGVISSLAFAAAILKRGQGLVWFPEGMRSSDGRLQPFKTGVGVLLTHHPVPVIPSFIRGTRKILPPGSAVPRRGNITVVFGRPLDAGYLARREIAGKKEQRIAQALHNEVGRLGRDIRP